MRIGKAPQQKTTITTTTAATKTTITNTTNLSNQQQSLFLNKTSFPLFKLSIKVEGSTTLKGSSRILSFPSEFFPTSTTSSSSCSSLTSVIGVCSRGLDLCFNWRLFQSDSKEIERPQTSNFGSGPITIISMDELNDEFGKSLYIESVPLGQFEDTSMGLASLRIDEKDSSPSSSSYIPFFTGRTNISAGVIRLFRDYNLERSFSESADLEIVSIKRKIDNPETELSTVSAIYEFPGLAVVLILAIPISLTPANLINFVGKGVVERARRIRLLRDAAPNRYLALIKFESSTAALNFIESHDGRAFTPLQPEICHIVPISSVEFTTKASILEPLFDESDFSNNDVGSIGYEINFVEIPTCPVCLERIDSSATGVMVAICQHKFHCKCLERWSGGSCPVCRHSLQRIKTSNSSINDNNNNGRRDGEEIKCSSCDVDENIWLCLICGDAGCGRYDKGHAYDHYCSTGHCFALEVNTHRVWDYIGDNYVHRLVQNEKDGKLVELPAPNDGSKVKSIEKSQMGKIDAGPDYYSSMLVAQLESQRNFYKERLDSLQLALLDRLDRLNKEHSVELCKLNHQLDTTKVELDTLQIKVVEETQKMESEIVTLTNERLALITELASERAMSEQASKTAAIYSELVGKREEEIASLTEQIQDLMMHLESQHQASQGGELAGGTIIIKSSPTKHNTSRRRQNR